MRIGAGSGDGPLAVLEGAVRSIQDAFMDAMREATATAKTKVMLGDATVTEEETFDPGRVGGIFAGVAGRLEGWQTDGVMSTNNEDIRRIFVKFQTRAGNYLLSGHLSIQFHVLLYYMPKQRVIDCQRELSEIVDAARTGEQEMADISDKLIAEKLRSMGYDGMDHQELFELLYEDDSLRGSLESQMSGDDAVRHLAQKKSDLFGELDSLLTETYRMAPVLIDDSRLVTGEEGCLCTFDVEYVRGGTRRSIPRRISRPVLESLGEKLAHVRGAIRDAGRTSGGNSVPEE